MVMPRQPQDVINQVNQLSNRIAPIQGKVGAGTASGQEVEDYQKANTQRNALLASVPGLPLVYERGIAGYLYVNQNQKPLPGEGLSYDQLVEYGKRYTEESAKNIYAAGPNLETHAKVSEAYKADVAKTEGIQINPQTKAIEAKPGYQISPAGEVSKIPAQEPEKPKAPEPESVKLISVGTVTPDVLYKYPGAKVGDKFAVTDTGEEIMVAASVGAGDRVIKSDAVAAARALREAQQAEGARQKAEKTPIEGNNVILADGQMMPIKGEGGWEQLPDKYKQIGLTKGYDAIVTAIKADNAVSEAKLKAHNEAKETLKSFRNEDDSYSVLDALLTRNPKVLAAIDTLFEKDIVDKIKYDNRAALTIGTGIKPKRPSSVKFLESSKPETLLSSDQVTATQPDARLIYADKLLEIATRTGGGVARIADFTKTQIEVIGENIIDWANQRTSGKGISVQDADRIRGQVGRFASDVADNFKDAAQRIAGIANQRVETKSGLTVEQADKIKGVIAAFATETASNAERIANQRIDTKGGLTVEEADRIKGAIGDFLKSSTENVRTALQNYADTHSGLKPEQLEEISARNRALARGDLSRMGAIAITAAPQSGGVSASLVVAAVGASALAGIKLREVVEAYKAKTGVNPTTADVIVVDSRGNVDTLNNLRIGKDLSKLGQIPPLAPPQIEKKAESIEVRGAREGIRTSMPIAQALPKIPEFKGVQKDISAIYIPMPIVKPEEITGQQAGLLLSKVRTIEARDQFEKALNEAQFDKVLESAKPGADQIRSERLRQASQELARLLPSEVQYIQEQEAIRRASSQRAQMAAITSARNAELGRKMAQDAAFKRWVLAVDAVAAKQTNSQAKAVALRHSGFVRKSYQEYLAKVAALEAAKRSYVSSLNPIPLKGGADASTQSLVAAYKLSQVQRLPQYQTGQSLDTYLQSATKTQALRAQAIKVATSLQAGTQTATKAAQATKAATQAKTAIRQAVQTKTTTRAQTRVNEATRAATNAALRAASATGTRVVPRTAENIRTAEATATARIIKIPIILSGKAINSKKPWSKRDIKSAVAWPQGELEAGQVIYARRFPYRDPEDTKVFVGKDIPKGLRISPDQLSAFKGIRLTRGKLSRAFTTKIGNQIAVVTPSGRGVKIDFSVTPSITDRRALIEERKAMRISKRNFPRISRR